MPFLKRTRTHFVYKTSTVHVESWEHIQNLAFYKWKQCHNISEREKYGVAEAVL